MTIHVKSLMFVISTVVVFLLIYNLNFPNKLDRVSTVKLPEKQSTIEVPSEIVVLEDINQSVVVPPDSVNGNDREAHNNGNVSAEIINRPKETALGLINRILQKDKPLSAVDLRLLAVTYFKCSKTPQSAEEAQRLHYKMLNANLIDPDMAEYLGGRFQFCLGVAGGERQALEYMKEAAELDDVNAQLKLYRWLYSYNSTSEQRKEAISWLQRAVSSGDRKANITYNIFLARESTLGIDKAKNFRAAALLGDPGAMVELSLLYQFGTDDQRTYHYNVEMDNSRDIVAKDLKFAYVWMSLASDQGYPSLKETLQSIYNTISPHELAEAEQQIEILRKTIDW